MTISSSLNAGVAGLSANANRLATISDNIANAATVGYKRVETDFHAMVNGNSAGNYSAGGVRASTTRYVDQSGTLRSTSNTTDLAVRGRGFLPVTTRSAIEAQGGGLPMLLTTTGSFRPDAEDYLQTPAGIVLMGWPVAADGTVPAYPRDSSDSLVPVKIQRNQFAGEATTQMSVGVNLPATSTEHGSTRGPEQLSLEYFDNLGMPRNLKAEFRPVTAAAPNDPGTNQWRMVIRDSASSDAIVGVYDLQFDPSRGSGGTLQSVSRPVVDPATGLDNPAGAQIGGAYATDGFQVTVAGGPIDVTIGAIGSTSGFTQLSDTFAPTTIDKNGAPVGNMTGVEVDANGFVFANFDTGVSRKLYQVPLVDMPNPNGLEALDNQTYAPSMESGGFFLWNAADGPTGEIVGNALEESSVDVAGELTSLIQTQRAYSSNAKVIQTVDEMLQETTNIKR